MAANLPEHEQGGVRQRARRVRVAQIGICSAVTLVLLAWWGAGGPTSLLVPIGLLAVEVVGGALVLVRRRGPEEHAPEPGLLRRLAERRGTLAVPASWTPRRRGGGRARHDGHLTWTAGRLGFTVTGPSLDGQPRPPREQRPARPDRRWCQDGAMTADPTVPPADTALLEEAVDIARAAGRLTLDWFAAADLAVDRKDDGTPVTAADRAAERLVRERLADGHPHDTVLGEEEDDVTGTSGRTWIVDPIDGTKAFTRGVPLYSTLVAVLDEHGPAIGVIDLPALGHTVWAGRGLGCHLDGRPVRVSDRHQPADSVLSTSGYSWWPDEALLAVKHAGFQLRTWGDGYGYALVATGAVEAMVDPEVSLWDVAPMPVIISEAGGRFTDTSGTDVVLTPGRAVSGVATNGAVHDLVLGCLRPGDG